MKKINHVNGGRFYSDVLEEGLRYIEDRMNNRIKSFKVPWVGLNRAGVGGLEWGSMLTIGARPGSGKTLVVSQILRESRTLNSTQDFNILEFQFEMGGKQSAARAFAAETALDYNVVLSTDKQLDAFSKDMMGKYRDEVKALEDVGIYRVMINEPLTHKQMKETIIHYYNELGGKPMVVTIDHSWLIKKMSDEKEKIATLYNTTEMIMQLKNQLPICVIMITQLNRSIEEPIRKTPGTIGNYPTSSDIFGGDALMQGSDMVIALNRPFTVNIPFYGPKGYMVNPDDVFMHLLKIRNGSDNITMLFMKAEFKRQRMIEVGEPQATNQGSGRAGGGYVRLSQRNTAPVTPDDLDVDDID